MKIVKTARSVPIPDGVTVLIKSRRVKVTGPRGSLQRSFKHQSFDMFVKDGKVNIELWFGNRKTISAVRTIASHIANMITGVTKGYEYKMRFVYAHFPHNVVITDDGTAVEIRNFLGERITRRVEMLEGVKIVRSEDVKDEVVLTGNDIELVSQSAANINLKTLARLLDRKSVV